MGGRESALIYEFYLYIVLANYKLIHSDVKEMSSVGEYKRVDGEKRIKKTVEMTSRFLFSFLR